MDAIKILGSLLSNNGMGSSVGSDVLGSLLGGGGKSNAATGILGTLLGGSQRQSGGGLGALGGLLGAAASNGTGKDALSVLGGLLGGGGGSGSGSLGGLADLLGGSGQRQAQQSGGGGIAGMLSGLLGGGKKQQQSSGGAGDLLGSLLGGGGGAALAGLLGSSAQSGNASDMLGALLGGGNNMQAPPEEAHSEAEILVCAMCNAAKSDGQIDEKERDTILGRLNDLGEEEVEFLKKELSSPLDLEHFVRDVPADMTQQVYAFSLMAIKLDTQKEAKYFGELAQALNIDADTANEIHKQLGQPEIFA